MTARSSSTSRKGFGSGSWKPRPRSITTSITWRSFPERRRRPRSPTRRSASVPPSASADGAPRVEAGGAFVEFHQGQAEEVERPLLNHLAVLVDSTEEHIREANELGLEIADVVDAANTYALFVWGPERVKIEYVEHKASFSLV